MNLFGKIGTEILFQILDFRFLIFLILFQQSKI